MKKTKKGLLKIKTKSNYNYLVKLIKLAGPQKMKAIIIIT